MITSESFGKAPSGEDVIRFTLSLDDGRSMSVLSWGATLQGVRVPDHLGVLNDVVLGYRMLGDYVAAPGRLGATMGRFANRIGGAHFEIDGVTYGLFANENRNSIHGGQTGFDKKVWTPLSVTDDRNRPAVQFQLVSPDGDEGFPGTLCTSLEYALDAIDGVVMTYIATTRAPTVLNLTNHAYFNLGGEGSGPIDDHVVQIHADSYLPVGDDLLPTGEIRPVDGSALDFRQPKPIGRDLRTAEEQLLLGRGFDHCFCLSRSPGHPILAALVTHPSTGRRLEVLTTEPGLQLHSGNVLTGRYAGLSGRAYRQTDGFCLEAQHFPDSPNQPGFPTTVLRPGERYQAITIYRFGTTSCSD